MILKAALLIKIFLVLATAVTLAEDKFKRLMAQYDHQARIHTLACPGIVEFVEKGITEGPELTSYLTDLFKDYLDTPPDCVVLGCTHYPILLPKIRKYVPDSVTVLPQGEIVGRSLADYLSRHPEIDQLCSKSGSVNFLTTETPEQFDSLASLFMEGQVNSMRITL